jgi:hypothetical protein
MDFIRYLQQDLLKWKNEAGRKPLILHGARQVGKTWLLKHFGQTYFEDVAYFNFDEQSDFSGIFDTNKGPRPGIRECHFLA